jgi:hypothetical protein
MSASVLTSETDTLFVCLYHVFFSENTFYYLCHDQASLDSFVIFLFYVITKGLEINKKILSFAD